MPIHFTIGDQDLLGFSDPAQAQLKETLDKFANDLISEANRIEASSRGPAHAPDVNAAMVRDATSFVRRGIIATKASKLDRLVRILAPGLSLLVGIIWDRDSLQDGTYLIIFGSVLAAALITVTLVAVRD